MEQTLGKRISTARKSLGLTQDQLAERLGVTAQAVSKWENDLSCPDITTLPRLAGIFGTTTDALLGIDREPIPGAEVILEKAPDHGEPSRTGTSWEFRYDNSRSFLLCFSLWILSVGIVCLASNIFIWNLDLWTVIWTTALSAFGVFGLLRKFSFLRLGSCLLGLLFLLERILPLPFQIQSYLLPGLLIILGLNLLLHALRRRKKPLVSFSIDGKEYHSNLNEFRVGEDTFTFSASFGNDRRKLTLPLLRGGRISTIFGDFQIDLSGVEAVSDKCCLEANCSFGNLTVLVPRKFQVISDSSASFAHVEFLGEADPEPKGTVYLEGSASFGRLLIEYI